MARERVTQRASTKKRWGVQNGTTAPRKRSDGTSYIEFRHPYYANVPLLENGEIVGHERKRLWAASSISPTEAKNKAERLAKKYEEAEEEYWKATQIRHGTRAPDPQPQPPRKRKRPTLVECANEWMGTRKRYRDGEVVGAQFGYRKKQNSYINTLLESPLNSHHMDELQAVDVVDWFVNTYMTEHKETTSARFKAWLLSVGEWGLKNKYWENNLFESLPALSAKASNKDDRVFSLDEIDAMWGVARTAQERALLVLLRVGLRQGECTALSADMLIDEQTIFVRYTLGYEDNHWKSRSPLGKVPKTVPFLHPAKGSSSGRVHVPKPWMKYLKESAELAGYDMIRAYDDQSDHENPNPGQPRLRKFVCCNRYGLSWSDTCVSEALRNLMARAGVQVGKTGQTFHAWRHALASDLMAMGCGDMELAYLMRHRDYNMSKSIYASARQEKLSEYKRYVKRIGSPRDYIDALCKFDEDRRSKNRVVGTATSQVSSRRSGSTKNGGS